MAKFVDNARNLAGINMQTGYTPISSSLINLTARAYKDSAPFKTALECWGRGRVGNGGTIFDLNTGGYLAGTGASNSIGAVLYSAHDNATWVQTDNTAFGAEYVVEGKGGIIVGTPGNNSLNRVTINGPLTVTGGCTGCALFAIMQNTGRGSLHPGDVASMSSAVAGPAMLGDQPLVGADLAQGAYNGAVAGVVAHKVHSS